MSKLLVIVGVVSLTASGFLSATKCDDAKAYLSQNRTNIIATLNLETSDEIMKGVQQASLKALGYLDRAIERIHQHACGLWLHRLRTGVAQIESDQD